MNFSDLQIMVSDWLDDVNNGYFTLPRVKQWINNAQREVQKQLVQMGENYYVITATTTLVVGQNDYIVPSDFYKEHRLEVVLSGTPPEESLQKVEPITLNQMEMLPPGKGVPQGFYLKKDRFSIYPAPDTALTMRLYYSPMVNDMVLDSDTPDCPTPYQEYIAILAARDGYLKDHRDPSVLDEKMAYYSKLMLQDMEDRTYDSPRSVVITQGDGFDNLF